MDGRERAEYRRRQVLRHWQCIEIDLHSAGALRQTSILAHLRVQLTGVADDLAVDKQLSAAARVPRQHLSVTDLQLDVGSAGNNARGFDGVGDGVRGLVTPRAIQADTTAGDSGDVQRLLRQRLQQLGALGLARQTRGRRHRRDTVTALDGYLLHTVERQVDLAASNIALQRFKHGRQQSRAQLSMVGLQRVDDLDGVTTRVISVQAPDVEDIVGNERCRQNLQVAIVSQRVADEAATQLTLGQTATGRGDWEDNRNVFQALQT